VYIDPVTNQIEHKVFRKARNSLERIPWASHHPKDVKKGTFIGEMSRLATLSSKPCHYSEACKELGLLYIARGYPADLVKAWIKEHSAKRWRSRLGEPKADDDVFVLKSCFNQAWSMFNAHELGRLVCETWHKELQSIEDSHARLTANEPNDEFKDFLSGKTKTIGGGGAVDDPVGSHRADVFIRTLRRIPGSQHLDFVEILDVRKVGFTDRQWLVSRKRNRNLFDFVASLKKSVLAKVDHDQIMIDDMGVWGQ
jgi:hypothetical protein